MADGAQGEGSRSAHRRLRAAPVSWFRRVEFWVIVGAVLGFVLLNHFDLLLHVGDPGLRSLDPEAVIQNEFPNPFPELDLDRGWESGHSGWLLLIHLGGTLAAGVLLLRVLGSWPAALAGSVLYGVHPVHVALLGEGLDFTLVLAPIPAFLGCRLLWGTGPARPLGALLLALAAVLDPTALMLPVLLGLIRLLAPNSAPTRSALGWSGVAMLVGIGATVGLGVRAWPRLALQPGLLPPGPPDSTPVQTALLTLGRAMRHLYTTTFSGVDYGRGEVPFAWTWADAGAVWLAATIAAALFLLAAARLAPRGHRTRPLFGLAAAGAIAGLLLPLPGLAASLHTAEGFVSGQLLMTAVVPALLLGLLVRAALGHRRPPPAARRIIAAALALGIVVPASLATFRWTARSTTEKGAMRAALDASVRSYRLRRRYQEMLLRHGHNKLELKQHFEALSRERPEDPRVWAALGRFNWVIRRFGPAAAAFEKALARDPGNRGYRYSMAAARLLARRPAKALEALAGLPQDVPEVRALRMLARARAGQRVSAPDEASAAPIVQRAWGMILTEAGRYAEGLEWLERVQSARQKDALTAAYRGWCLLGLGRVEEAEDVLLFEALRDESGFLAHKLLGDLYMRPGPRHNRREAYFHYSYFVKHDRGDPEVPRILKILEQIQTGDR